MVMVRSLVIGASGGIGEALLERCAGDGEVVALSRKADGLDLLDEQSVARTLERIEGRFDRIFIATGILATEAGTPEKKLDDCDPSELARLMAVNAIGPLLVLKHLKPRLPRDASTRIGVLSARVGSIGDNRMGGWYGYRASKAALNQYLRSAAIEFSRTHKNAVLAALHPGTVATPFTADYQGRHRTVSPEAAAQNLVAVLDSLTPSDTGSFRDQNGKPIAW